MNNEVQVFGNDEFGEIRAIEVEGQALFVANDIANKLGYKRPNDAINTHCKGTVKHSVLTNGGKQELNVIPEGDIYRLIFRSKLPSAERFEKWVVDDVLPTIRKHGAYMTPDVLQKAITDPDFLIQLATQLKVAQSENQDLKLDNNRLSLRVGELKPKADYTDTILKSKELVTVTQISKDYGLSGQALNKLLHELGVQYKQSGQWFLYSKHHDKGYTHSETHTYYRSNGTEGVRMTTKWRQKGRLFLYELLKSEGHLPIIEMEMD